MNFLKYHFILSPRDPWVWREWEGNCTACVGTSPRQWTFPVHICILPPYFSPSNDSLLSFLKDDLVWRVYFTSRPRSNGSSMKFFSPQAISVSATSVSGGNFYLGLQKAFSFIQKSNLFPPWPLGPPLPLKHLMLAIDGWCKWRCEIPSQAVPSSCLCRKDTSNEEWRCSSSLL